MSDRLATLWNALLATRRKADRVAENSSPGIYALFLDRGSLAGILPSDDGLLYIGMTGSSLTARNHIFHASSGFSTLRRSLGAILKADLDLKAIPRSSGSKGSHFKFLPDGEQRLTDWMKAHLSYGAVPVMSDIRKTENRLILDQRPPLNLKGWKNPQAALIKSLRAHCAHQGQAIVQHLCCIPMYSGNFLERDRVAH